jgi:hypothetical protein
MMMMQSPEDGDEASEELHILGSTQVISSSHNYDHIIAVSAINTTPHQERKLYIDNKMALNPVFTTPELGLIRLNVYSLVLFPTSQQITSIEATNKLDASSIEIVVELQPEGYKKVLKTKYSQGYDLMSATFNKCMEFEIACSLSQVKLTTLLIIASTLVVVMNHYTCR